MVHEPPGFRRFVEARYSSLVPFGVVLCGEADRGEELTQVALLDTLHVWNRQGVGLGDPEGHTRTVMTQRAWRTAHRRGGAPPVEQAPAPVVPAVLDGFVPTEPEAAAPVDAGEAMRGALAALPAQQRVVLVLRFWGHLSEAEVASELRCSTGTVRNRAARAVAALRDVGLLDDTVGAQTSAEARRIEQLLTRAADVPPVSTQPTDDVLARAELGPRARFRRRLLAVAAVVVGCALLIGAGAVALSDGDAPVPRPVTKAKPLRLTVDLPAGWRYDDSGLALTCSSTLQARTVYRGATIGDLRCRRGEGPTVDGPVLVAGRLERLLAERVRTTGTPGTIGDRAAWVEPGGDSPHAFATYLLGGTDNLGYVVVAPRGAGRQKPVVTSLQGEDVSPVPVAALEAGSGVGVRGGERLTRHLLPPTVRAMVLTTEPRSTDAAPGATAWSPEGVRQILRHLRPVHRPMPPCGPPIRGRTLWLQQNTGSWVRVDVTADATGCNAAVSELGGGGRVAGDPVGMARFVDEGEPRSEVSGSSRLVRGAGMSFVLPAGWQVTEGEGFDPCTALLPTVVVAERLAPSCLHGLGQRPSQPYLWITKQPLEKRRTLTGDGLPLLGRSRLVTGRDEKPIRWTEALVEVDGVTLHGRLGVPEKGAGRMLLVGVRWVEGATLLERLAASS